MDGSVRRLHLVATIELAKGMLALLVAGVLIGWLKSQPDAAVNALIRHLHIGALWLDPSAIDHVLRVGRSHTMGIGLAALCYAAVRFVEAYGLWQARAWAWGFGMLSGAMYIPMEIFELWKHPGAVSVAALAINILVMLVLWPAKGRTH